MLTSATGCCEPAAASRGFTLVEMLVVLVMLGVLASLVAVSISGDTRRDAIDETERLKLVLELAVQEAHTSGRAIAFVPESGGYRFVQADLERRWRPITDDEYLRPRRLVSGMRVDRILVDGQVLPAGTWLVFASTAVPLFRIEVGSPNGTFVLRARVNGRIDVTAAKAS